MILRSRAFWILIWILGAACPSPSAPVIGDFPRESRTEASLQFESQEADLGPRLAGENFEVVFRFRNKGDHSIHPLALKKSCTCIKPAFEPEIIEAGAKGVLRVKGYVDTRQNTGGKFTYMVLARCEDQQPSLVRIKGQVLKGLQVYPSMIQAKGLPDQAVVRVPVRFLFNEEPLPVKGVRNLPPGVELELMEPCGSGGSSEWFFVLNVALLPTHFHYNLQMVPSSSKPDVFQYQLEGSVDRAFELYPNLIFFNDVVVGHPTTRTLDVVQLRDDSELPLLQVKINEELTCTPLRKPNGKLQLVFVVTPMRIGYTRGTVRIPVQVEHVSREQVIPFSYDAHERGKGEDLSEGMSTGNRVVISQRNRSDTLR